jgi:hypothetical protein
MLRMKQQALSRPYLVHVAARVVTQETGPDGGVDGLLAGGGGGGWRASANGSRQHIGCGFFVKRGGKHGERLNRGADLSRRSLQSGNQRVFAEQDRHRLGAAFGCIREQADFDRFIAAVRGESLGVFGGKHSEPPPTPDLPPP